MCAHNVKITSTRAILGEVWNTLDLASCGAYLGYPFSHKNFVFEIYSKSSYHYNAHSFTRNWPIVFGYADCIEAKDNLG